ncbi:MAG: RuBisCO accumulation factor 1 [Leptolyngbyaceae cyanobacterium]
MASPCDRNIVMSDFQPPTPDSAAASSDLNAEALLQLLRRKQGNWLEWGQACQHLQKAAYTPQAIFEATGFEPIQQNQIIVAAQVFSSLVEGKADAATQQHFSQRGSDILYELRVLTQAERAAVASLVAAKALDAEEAKEVTKAVKEFTRLKQKPEGFTDHPGDAVAYQVWRLARQKTDLQERSRLIAKGLRFAHSQSARTAIEQLLTDFTITPTAPVPLLPVYQLEAEEQMPRLIPVVGKLPLAKADLQSVPLIEPVPPFGVVQFTGSSAWVAMPGWQVILAAQDPVALLCSSHQLPAPLPGPAEEVLIVIDRAERDWDANRYFLVEQAEQLTIQWSDQPFDGSIQGRVVVVLRPKKILDQNYTEDLLSKGQRDTLKFWQYDE